MSDFDDRPLVAGSVTGLRSFRVDSLGRLTGITHRAVFRPGENVGECRKREDGDLWQTVMYPYGYTSPNGFLPGGFTGTISLHSTDPYARLKDITADAVGVKDITVKKPKKPAAHKVGQKSCGCGFYAYFDGSNDYRSDNAELTITAIVEGYGTVTYGARGFRAEKARLVALVIPEKVRPRHAYLVDRVRHNYADVPVFTKVKAALSEHPLTLPEPLTPETCDDFWTREAAS